ncbi:MAG: hypothetical protein U0Q12_19875 [Vicinamibacterales bacterium]
MRERAQEAIGEEAGADAEVERGEGLRRLEGQHRQRGVHHLGDGSVRMASMSAS